MSAAERDMIGGKRMFPWRKSGHRRRTVARDLTLWLTLAVSIMVGVVGFVYYASSTAILRRRLHADASRITGELSEVLTLPSWNLDKEGIERVARAYLKSEHLVGVRVELHYDDEVDVVYDNMPRGGNNLIRRKQDIVKGDSMLGVVESAFTDEGIRRIQNRTIMAMVITTALAIVVIVLGTRYMLHSLLTKHLQRLTEGIGRIAHGEYRRTLAPVAQEDINAIINEVNLMASQIAARTEDLQHEIVEHRNAEVELQKHREQLEELVAERTADLSKTNEQLEGEIAERKRVEEDLQHTLAELERSNTELEQFAYAASHDLQEPLRKITSFGERLETKYGTELGEAGIHYIDRMRDAASRMRVLIDDLLALSRVTMKAQPFAKVNLSEVAREVLADLEMRMLETGAQVKIGDLPVIDADRTQMRQLLQNLLGNALKFGQEGVPAAVEVTAEVEEGSRCLLSVRDNGIGFDEKHLDRIFTVFQRLHARGEYEGTGIGLAICRKIVERHGGTITARSQPGRGAAFVVSLPVTHTDRREDAPPNRLQA